MIVYKGNRTTPRLLVQFNIYLAMGIKEQLREHQERSRKQREAEFERLQKGADEYNNSEQAERDQWDSYQRLWEKKAQKEGWTYKPEPFISALERKQLAEKEKAEKIAYLESQLKALKEN